MSLSEKIQTILNARENIKQKIKQTQVEQQQVQDEVTKLAPALQEPLIREMQEQQSSLLARYGEHPSIGYPAITEAPATKKRKLYDLNPDKDIDEHLLQTLNLFFPSEFLKLYDEPQRTTAIQATVDKVNSILKSLGARKKKEGDRGEVARMIDSLRHYKESIKALQHIPRFEMQGTGVGGCQRLELLLASRSAGNDSDLIKTEAKQILSGLLKEKQITKADYNKIFYKYLA